MFDITDILGFAGTALVAGAYLPQIWHLYKEHCSAGVSVKAWLIWLLAAFLLLSHAIGILDPVFIALQAASIVLMVVLIALAYRYENSFCSTHRPAAAGAVSA